MAMIHDPARGARRMKLERGLEAISPAWRWSSARGGFRAARGAANRQLRQMLGRVTGLKRSLAQIFALALALEVSCC